MIPDDLFGLISKAVSGQLYDYPEPRRIYDVERFAYLMATWESAAFFTRTMPKAQNFVTRERLLEFALGQAPADGLTLEFGVAGGGSLRTIASMSAGYVYGFDSFEGLPEDWTHFQKRGRFSRGGEPPLDMPPNVRFVRGWFDETLPGFVERQVQPVRFLHVDCDLYSSTKTVLGGLARWIVPGTVILFDEYFNYPGWQEHEHKAFLEFVAHYRMRFEYLAFASSYYSVAVRILPGDDRLEADAWSGAIRLRDSAARCRRPLRVAIYGAGSAGARVATVCQHSGCIELVAVFDSDPCKHGLPFEKLRIAPPAMIGDVICDRLIIASLHAAQIREGLVNSGFPVSRIWTANVWRDDDAIAGSIAFMLDAIDGSGSGGR